MEMRGVCARAWFFGAWGLEEWSNLRVAGARLKGDNEVFGSKVNHWLNHTV